MTDTDTRELRPVDRFEWEQIVLRARWTGVITGKVGTTGKTTRGGVSPAAIRAVCWAIVSHANPDGTRVYPGDATLAVEAEVGVQIAQQVKRKLVDFGLIEKVRSRARRQRRGDEYRLTLPTDLLERLRVLSPAAVQAAAVDVYERRRGKRGGSDGSPTGPGVGGPMDPPQDGSDDAVGGPMDPPREPDDNSRGGSNGTPTDVCGGSNGTHVGDPMARDTNPETPQVTTDHPTLDKTFVRPSPFRARDAADEPDSSDGVNEPSDPPRPAGCPAHGSAMAAGLRPDGKPACPLCRRGAPPTVLRRDPDDDPEADEARQVVNGNWLASQTGRRAVAPQVRDQLTAERLADVVPLRPRTA